MIYKYNTRYNLGRWEYISAMIFTPMSHPHLELSILNKKNVYVFEELKSIIWNLNDAKELINVHDRTKYINAIKHTHKYSSYH